MPTSSAYGEEIEEMYEQIKEIIQIVKGDENLIVMGDWNSVVGKGREGNVVGEYGLGQRNERGSRLVEFCTEHNLIIANTWFKNHKRRLYTLKKPGDTDRFQIDYIMVRQRFRNQVLNCDHNLLAMTCRLKLKKLQKGGNLRRWDLDKLKEPEVVQSFREIIREQLTGMGERNTVEEEWVALRDEVVKAAEDQVGKKTKASRNPWVTEEILNLIDERRKYKNAVNEAGKKEYRRLKNEIDRKCKMAKQGWLEDKCKDVEAYLTRG
ncbi:craniofacial development protein 2-like [Schistocerca gregaria]|uniref:craniofacial development protein 2-like n=1 Tax=Schistocerca gregaria TaxID=7010 RepID=UPI00211E9C8C|nr:craniofacial development protein 2-like [Schistocerca gregaria]XP_049829377.1 craniofacial development protein 2-like [Schistocerca gregaria]